MQKARQGGWPGVAAAAAASAGFISSSCVNGRAKKSLRPLLLLLVLLLLTLRGSTETAHKMLLPSCSASSMQLLAAAVADTDAFAVGATAAFPSSPFLTFLLND